jgi:hypothetical protein
MRQERTSGPPAPPSTTTSDGYWSERPAESWTEPERPGEVIAGALSGSDDQGAREAHAAPDPTRGPDGRFVPSVVAAQAAPQTPGQVEEHAARVDPRVGEETGAAKPPSQPQPEGEYAQAEEVGSPDAPQADDDDGTLIGE